MKQSSKRLTSMLLALLFLTSAFLIFFDLIQPAYGDLQKKKGQEVSAQAFLVQERQTIAQAKKLIDQYANESTAADNLSLSMPSGKNLAGALAQIYGIAQNNGIVVQAIGVSLPAIAAAQSQQAKIQGQSGNVTAPLTLNQIVKPAGTISLQVTAAGSYENLKAFLAGLEANLRVFDVINLGIQSAPLVAGGRGGGAAQNFFMYAMTVATYYQLP